MSSNVDAGVVREFISAIKDLGSKKPEEKRYLTGTVTHTDSDGTVWVSVDGGVGAMPIERTTSSYSAGDLVSFSIENGVASMGGNVTDPPTSGDYVIHISRQVETVETHLEVVENVKADKVETNSIWAEIADLDTIRANSAKVENLTAEQLSAAAAYIASLTADNITAQSLIADIGKVHNLTAEQLSAAAAYIASLTAGSVTAQQIIAINGDFATVKANAAKVENLTAEQLEADHAKVGTLDTNYAQINLANVNNAWISNGTIKNGAISSAMINDVSANKLTAGTINGSVINVTNLNADNITTGTINGQRIGEGSLSLDKLSEDVYTESEVDAKLSTMQQQIDGAIETWTGTEVPTLQNAPASSWTTTQLKDQHVGDVYFVVNSQSQQNGYNYRFTKSGSSYSWRLIKDSDVTNALQRLETAEGKITTFDSDISTLKTDTGTLTTKTTNLETRMSDAESDILDKVDTTTFNELEDTVDGHTQTLSQHTTALSNKADSSTVTSLTTKVNKNETDISGINTTIGELRTTVESKADGSALTTVSNKLNTVSDTVDGHTQTISSVQSTLSTKADGSTVETLTTRVSTAESTIQQQANQISAKVSKDGVIAAINLSTEESGGSAVKINADKVNITGAAVFSAINNDTSTTKINGGKVDADTLHVNAANIDGSLTIGKVDGLQGALDGKASTTAVANAAKRTYVSIVTTALNYEAGTATLEATLYVDGTATTSNVTYEWLRDGSAISGATNRTLNVIAALGLEHAYSCKVTYGDIPAETGTIDLKAQVAAAKTASNYIAADATGVRIANANPSTATTYQHQTATNTEFVNQGVSTASFGGSKARIGAEANAHVSIDEDSVDIINGNGETVAYAAEDKFYASKFEATTAIYLGDYSLRMDSAGTLVIGRRS